MESLSVIRRCNPLHFVTVELIALPRSEYITDKLDQTSTRSKWPRLQHWCRSKQLDCRHFAYSRTRLIRIRSCWSPTLRCYWRHTARSCRPIASQHSHRYQRGYSDLCGSRCRYWTCQSENPRHPIRQYRRLKSCNNRSKCHCRLNKGGSTSCCLNTASCQSCRTMSH